MGRGDHDRRVIGEAREQLGGVTEHAFQLAMGGCEELVDAALTIAAER